MTLSLRRQVEEANRVVDAVVYEMYGIEGSEQAELEGATDLGPDVDASLDATHAV